METMLEGFKIEILGDFRKEIETQLDHNQYRIFSGLRKLAVDDNKIVMEKLEDIEVKIEDIEKQKDDLVPKLEIIIKKQQEEMKALIEEDTEILTESIYNIEELINLKLK